MEPKVKKPYLSKTLIANAVFALLAVTGLQSKIEISPEQFTMALTGLNIVLRLITKDKIGLND